MIFVDTVKPVQKQVVVITTKLSIQPYGKLTLLKKKNIINNSVLIKQTL